MGSKGGSTTVASNSPPPQVLDAYTSLLKQAQQVSSTPYTPYSGQQVASLTGLQNQGIQNISNSANIAQPYIGQAAGLANQSAQPIAGNLPQYNQQNLQQYQDPYQQQVIQATQANLNQNNAVQQQQLLGRAISSGASPFGGDRAGVAAGELARQQALANNQTIAGLQSQGFQNAQNEFNTQQQTQLQAQNADASRQAQASYLLGGLGTSAQSSALQGGLGQLQAGTVQQQQAQNELNVPYQNYLQQQAYPFATTQFLGNLTEGLGSQSGGTSQTTAPGQNRASGVAEGALAGAAAGSVIPGIGTAVGAIGGGLAGLFAKEGGKIDYDAGGLVGAANWVPQGKFQLGHSIPAYPRVQQDSSIQNVKGIGALASLGAKKGNTDLGNSMPWLNGTGAAANTAGQTDLGNEMPWLNGTGVAADNTGTIDLGDQMPWLNGAKHGGKMKGYADGGDVTDDSDDLDSKPTLDYSEDTAQIIYPHEADPDRRTLNLGIPSPKGNISQADTSQMQVKDSNGDLVIPLLTAAAGIAAGQGPGNIGQGALAGLQAYSQQQAVKRQQTQQDIANKRAEQQQQLLNQREKQTENYQSQEIAARNQALALEGAKNQEMSGYHNKLLDMHEKTADQGKYTMVAGTGQDENGQSVQGTYVFNAKTGKSDFQPGMVAGKGATPGSSKNDPMQKLRDESNAQFEAARGAADLSNAFMGQIKKAPTTGVLSPGEQYVASATNQLTKGKFGSTTATALDTAQKLGVQTAFEKMQQIKGARPGIGMLRLAAKGGPEITKTPEANQNITDLAKAASLGAEQQAKLANSWQGNAQDANNVLDEYYHDNPHIIQDANGEDVPNLKAQPIDQWLVQKKGLDITGKPIQRTASTPPPSQNRIAGQIYTTPKGNFKWTGTGWLPAN